MQNETKHKLNILFKASFLILVFLSACAIEDPSVAEFDLKKIRLNGLSPFLYNYENERANLFYSLPTGDTMEVNIYEYQNANLAKTFFYSSDSLTEKLEYLMEGERKRFLRWGRRVFVFSYQFPIFSSSLPDSLEAFTKRFPAADTSAGAADVSVQKDYFLGVEAPFTMLIRNYSDDDFSWVCAHSAENVSEEDFEKYKINWQNNFYGIDSTALIGRLSNGVVVAVYGDLDKERMRAVFKEFANRVK